MTTKTADDLEAVRTIADTLQPFTSDDRERIVRWAREKLGMVGVPTGASAGQRDSTAAASFSGERVATQATGSSDIKTFVAQKSPGSDTHFAATVAYYYQFMAPESARKASIGKDDVTDACRKVDRKRPATPAQVLVNAYHDGILDRAEKGQYKLNSVGENLVAMVLPASGEGKLAKPTSKKKSVRKSGLSQKRQRRRKS